MIGITITVTTGDGSDDIRDRGFFFDGTLTEAVELVQAWEARKSYFTHVRIEWSRPAVLPDDIREFAEIFDMWDIRKTFAV